MKLYAGLAKALVDNGLTTMFGIIGDANLYLVDSFIRDHGGRYITTSHENGAVLMALGYALRSKTVGVATVTHGPALTNAMTALAEGVKGRIPLVLLCGDTAVEDKAHSQSIEQRELVKAADAGFEQLRSPKTFADDLAVAIRRAVFERRPVVLNMPTEFQWLDCEYAKKVAHLPSARGYVPASDDLDNAIGIIAGAKRPVILAGRGATHAEAKQAILKLAERIGAPVCTTLRAKGLFKGEGFDLGICGTLSTPVASEIVAESDCLIAFGAALTKHTTLQGAFLKGKRVIQCNTEAADIATTYAVDIGLVGDAALVSRKIIHWLDEAEIASSGYRDEEMLQRLAAPPALPAASEVGVPDTVDFSIALRRLNAMLPTARNLVTDGGRYITMVWSHIDIPSPDAFIYTTNFGSIGLGMGYAIGATFASEAQTTVLFTGDGGFMLGGLVEFYTAVKNKCDLIVVICNDAAYGAEHIQFRDRGMDPSLALCDWPDFATVANALGGRGITVRSEADLDLVADAIRHRTAPLLIDLRLDPELVRWIK